MERESGFTKNDEVGVVYESCKKNLRLMFDMNAKFERLLKLFTTHLLNMKEVVSSGKVKDGYEIKIEECIIEIKRDLTQLEVIKM